MMFMQHSIYCYHDYYYIYGDPFLAVEIRLGYLVAVSISRWQTISLLQLISPHSVML